MRPEFNWISSKAGDNMRRMIILVALVAVAAGLWIMGEWNRGAELPESAFGTWESPLGARQVFAGADAVSFPRSTGDGLYFVLVNLQENGVNTP